MHNRQNVKSPVPFSRRLLLGAGIVVASGAGLRSEAAQRENAGGRPAVPTALIFPSRRAASASTVARAVIGLELLGYAEPGDGGAAIYKRVAAKPIHALWFQSADGAFWEWADRTLDIRMAGAVADGIWNRDGNWNISGGTDNTRAIQDCIDAHAFFDLCDHVYFPLGQFRIASPLHCHTGTYYPTPSVKLLGAGFSWRGSQRGQKPGEPGAGGGCLILCDFSDAFAVGVSSAGFTCRGIAFVGRNYAWIRGQELGVEPKVDDTVADNWVDPGLSANAASRTAPYACFAIDPYLGPHDAGSYPPYLPPPWVPERVIANSTDIEIDECYIGGFVVGIVDQPGGYDGNGDFLKTRRCLIECCQYALSIGNSQSRNVLRDSNTYYYCYCIETTKVHGARVGKMSGLSVNCACDRCIQIFQFGSTFYSGPIVYQSLYAEGLWRLGDVETNSVAETSVTFIDVQCFMNGESPLTRGAPATWLGSAGTFTSGHPVKITFIDCMFGQYPSVISFDFDSACIDANGLDLRSNAQVWPKGDYRGAGLRALPYEQFASNATADGLVLYDGQSRSGRMRLKFCQYNVDAGRPTPENISVIFAGPRQESSDRHHPACTYAQSLVESTDRNKEGVWLPSTAHVLDKAAIRSASLINRNLTFTLPSDWRASPSLAYRGPLPGDVILDQSTGSVFFVHSQSRLTGVVAATLQNNFRSFNRGTTFVTAVPIDLSTGSFVIINSRLFTPTKFLEGDLHAGSPVVTWGGNAGGRYSSMTKDLANGDYLYVDAMRDSPIDPEQSEISAVTAGSFSLAGPASYSTRRRLGVFIRPGAPNL